MDKLECGSYQGSSENLDDVSVLSFGSMSDIASKLVETIRIGRSTRTRTDTEDEKCPNCGAEARCASCSCGNTTCKCTCHCVVQIDDIAPHPAIEAFDAELDKDIIVKLADTDRTLHGLIPDDIHEDADIGIEPHFLWGLISMLTTSMMTDVAALRRVGHYMLGAASAVKRKQATWFQEIIYGMMIIFHHMFDIILRVLHEPECQIMGDENQSVTSRFKETAKAGVTQSDANADQDAVSVVSMDGDIHKILEIPSRISAVAWNSVTTSGTVLTRIPVTPMITSVVNASRWRSTNLLHFGMNYEFWKGSLKYTFEIVGSKFQQGQLYICYVPGTGLTVPPIKDAFNLNGIKLNLSESNRVDFVVPFVSKEDYLTCGPPVEMPVGVTPTYSATGQVVVYVLNPLIVNSTSVVANVTLNTWISAGDDFKFEVPRPMDVGFGYYNANGNPVDPFGEMPVVIPVVNQMDRDTNVPVGQKQMVPGYRPNTQGVCVDVPTESASTENIMEQEYVIDDNLILSTTDTINTVNTYAIPDAFFAAEYANTGLRNYHFLDRYDFDVKITLATTTFHQGLLVAAFVPYTIGNNKVPSQMVEQLWATPCNVPHVLINLNGQTFAEFTIPYSQITRLMNTGGSVTDQMGTLVIARLVPMSAGTGASTTVRMAITLKARNAYIGFRKVVNQSEEECPGCGKTPPCWRYPCCGEPCCMACRCSNYSFVNQGNFQGSDPEQKTVETQHPVFTKPPVYNYVGKLNEWMAREKVQKFSFEFEKIPPDHDPVFKCAMQLCYNDDMVKALGEGRTKIQAKQVAAHIILWKVGEIKVMPDLGFENQMEQPETDSTVEKEVEQPVVENAVTAEPPKYLDTPNTFGELLYRADVVADGFIGEDANLYKRWRGARTLGRQQERLKSIYAFQSGSVTYQVVDGIARAIPSFSVLLNEPPAMGGVPSRNWTQAIITQDQFLTAVSMGNAIYWQPGAQPLKTINVPQYTTTPVKATGVTTTNVERNVLGYTSLFFNNGTGLVSSGSSPVTVLSKAGTDYSLYYLTLPPMIAVGLTRVDRMPPNQRRRLVRSNAVIDVVNQHESERKSLLSCGDVEANPGPVFSRLSEFLRKDPEDPEGQSSTMGQLIKSLVGLVGSAATSSVHGMSTAMEILRKAPSKVLDKLVSELSVKITQDCRDKFLGVVTFVLPLLKAMLLLGWAARKWYLWWRGTYSFLDLMSDMLMVYSSDVCDQSYEVLKNILDIVQGEERVHEDELQNQIAQAMDAGDFSATLATFATTLLFGCVGLNAAPHRHHVLSVLSTRVVGTAVNDGYKLLREALKTVINYFFDGVPKETRQSAKDRLERLAPTVSMLMANYYDRRIAGDFNGAAMVVNRTQRGLNHPLEFLIRCKSMCNTIREPLSMVGGYRPWVKWMEEVEDTVKSVQKNYSCAYERVEPVGILLAGDPGQGKSYLATHIIPEIVLSRCRFIDSRTQAAYNRYSMPNNPDQQYLDGYWGQPYVMYDDLGASRDGRDYLMMLNFISTAVAPINMADLKDKGQLFTSAFVCATTNVLAFGNGTNAMNNANALVRRFPCSYHITARDEFRLEGKLDFQMLTRQLNQADTHVQELAVYNRAFEVRALNTEDGTVQATIPFENMINRICGVYTRRCQHSNENYEARMGIEIGMDNVPLGGGHINPLLEQHREVLNIRPEIHEDRIADDDGVFMDAYPQMDVVNQVEPRVWSYDNATEMWEARHRYGPPFIIACRDLVQGAMVDGSFIIEDIIAVGKSVFTHDDFASLPVFSDKYMNCGVVDGWRFFCLTMYVAMHILTFWHRGDMLIQARFHGYDRARVFLDPQPIIDLRQYHAEFTRYWAANPMPDFPNIWIERGWTGLRGIKVYAREKIGRVYNSEAFDTVCQVVKVAVLAGIYAIITASIMTMFLLFVQWLFSPSTQAYSKDVRKTAPRNHRPQVVAVENQNDPFDYLQDNLIGVSTNGGESTCGYAYVLDDRHVMFNSHYVDVINAKGGLYYLEVANVDGQKVGWREFPLTRYTQLSVAGKRVDMVIVRTPEVMQGYRKRRCFLTEEQFGDWCAGLRRRVTLKASWTGFGEDESCIVQGMYETPPRVEMWGSTTFLGCKVTRSTIHGMCGTPYVRNDGRVVGFHANYSGPLKTAGFAPVTVEAIDAALARLSVVEGPTSHVDYYPAVVVENQLKDWTSNDKLFECRGKYKDLRVHVPMGTDRVESEMHDTELWPDGHRPTLKSHDILVRQSQKYGFTTPSVAPSVEEEDFVCNYFESVLQKFPDRCQDLLTDDQILNGDEELGILGVKRDTSAGIWNKVSNAKKDLLDRLEDEEDGKVTYQYSDVAYSEPHPVLGVSFCEYLRFRELMAKQGFRVSDSFWNTTLKDELKPTQKVLDGKTRVFECPPFDLTVLYKKYFGAFAGWYRGHAGPILSHAIGLDKEASWHILYEHLQKDRVLGIDIDYKEFDGTLPPAAFTHFLRLCSLYYTHETEEERAVRAVLIHELQFTQQIILNHVCQSYKGNKSGNWLTDMFNSVTNTWAWMIAFYRQHLYVFQKAPRIVDWVDNVTLFTLGDDATASVSEWCGKWYHGESIGTVLKSLGFKATGADKEELKAELKDVSELTFLKSGFVYYPEQDVVLPPMPKTTSYREINWVKSKWRDNVDVRHGMIADACRFASYHGREFYDDFVNKLIKNQGKEQVLYLCPYDPPTWRQVMNEIRLKQQEQTESGTFEMWTYHDLIRGELLA